MIGTNPGNLSHFMAEGGEFGGSEKCCDRDVAEFCEKVRIATGTKKCLKRLAIEAEGREETFLGNDGKKRDLVKAGTNPYLARDEIGRQVVKCQRTR